MHSIGLMIRIQDDDLAIGSMVDQDSPMKESAAGMLHRLLQARSLRNFMKLSDDVPEKHPRMVVVNSLLP